MLEIAKVRLAVEVSEFDLKLAQHRRRQIASAATSEGAWMTRREQHGSFAAHEISREYAEAVQAVKASSEVEPLLRKLADYIEGLEAGDAAPEPAGFRPPPRRRPAPPAPAAPAPLPGEQRPTMRHLFEDWKRTQTKERSIHAVQGVVEDFREHFGPLPAEEITKAEVRRFRDLLIERKLSQGTIENRLGFLSTLVRHGQKEMVDHLTVNPFANVQVIGANPERKKKRRRAYTVPELNKLFSSKLYQRSMVPLPPDREVDYWLPLLGAFVGARIEELCQLRIEDVQRINGHWCVRICNLDDEQSIKTDSSFRRVPLHESLIRCGFLAFVARSKAAGNNWVFSGLSSDNALGTLSNAPGKRFLRYLRSIGLTDSNLDFHSFRYTFRQQCSLCGLQDEVRDALTGHWLTRSDSGRTYMKGENAQYPFPAVVSAIKQLAYGDLRLDHLAVAEPMAGVDALTS